MALETIRFEGFELDSRSFELRRAGHLVKLERIPLQLLFLLAENRERLVTREEILQVIWGKDVFVDADNSINTAVRKARQALADDPENPRFLRTIPGKGYRFTAPVTSSSSPVAESAEVRVDRTSPRRLVLWVVSTGVVLAMLLAGGLILRSHLTRAPKINQPKATLVVLPFVNFGGDARDDYFADGITEEIITELGRLDPQHLGVIARTTSMQYKNAKKGAREVARELGADYLLEGSVRRADQRVRVTAQLIQASDQTQLWAADFDRDLNDVLKLQSDLAFAISGKIQLTLSPPTRTRLAEAPSLNGIAYETYLRGLHDSDLRTKSAVVRAIAEFQKAIEIDPTYAPAHAALARAYSLSPVVGAMTTMEVMPKAREAALRAISLDPALAAGHTTLAFVLAHYDFDWPAAEREYLRALDLDPNDPLAHMFYSNSYLSPLGRHGQAIDEMQKAVALDLFSAPAQSFLGRTYIWARQYDKALLQFQKCQEIFPGFAIGYERLAQLHALLGKFEDAIAEDTKARLLSGENDASVFQKATVLRDAWISHGARGYWKQTLELTQLPDNPPEAYSSPFGAAILYAHLGEETLALDSLEKAFDQRSLSMTEIAIEPAFDALHADPRFQTLLRRVGLEKRIVNH
jgi:TolB-like protein/DNA-binding winged helix-turn-helix (wHTH) protein/Tfp pilus assembly protein PilF